MVALIGQGKAQLLLERLNSPPSRDRLSFFGRDGSKTRRRAFPLQVLSRITGFRAFRFNRSCETVRAQGGMNPGLFSANGEYATPRLDL